MAPGKRLEGQMVDEGVGHPQLQPLRRRKLQRQLTLVHGEG